MGANMHRQSLYRWFNENLRGKKGQRGFTLIELLVVVTILGVLAGIVTLSLVGLTTNANTQACNTEYKTVQSALDAYMADKQLSSITQQDKYTNDMTGGNNPQAPVAGNVPLFVTNPSAINPNYTRNGTTQFWYTWDATGKIGPVIATGSTVAIGNGIGSNAGGAGVANCAPR
jgi:prepilin-type N-terminal cleavage/methylation domain-containing protein